MTMQTPASISPSHLPTEDEGEDFDDQETVRSSMSPRLDSGHELGPAKRTALAHLRMNAEPEPFSSTRIAVSLLPLVPQISMRKNRVKGKPLECPAPGCGKKFNFPSGLAEHYRTHSGERPFQCVHCGRGFTTKNRLHVHSRIHTEEKPYVCNFPDCDFAARQSSDVTQHYRNVHEYVNNKSKVAPVSRRRMTAPSGSETIRNTSRAPSRGIRQKHDEPILSKPVNARHLPTNDNSHFYPSNSGALLKRENEDSLLEPQQPQYIGSQHAWAPAAVSMQPNSFPTKREQSPAPEHEVRQPFIAPAYHGYYQSCPRLNLQYYWRQGSPTQDVLCSHHPQYPQDRPPPDASFQQHANLPYYARAQFHFSQTAQYGDHQQSYPPLHDPRLETRGSPYATTSQYPTAYGQSPYSHGAGYGYPVAQQTHLTHSHSSGPPLSSPQS